MKKIVNLPVSLLLALFLFSMQVSSQQNQDTPLPVDKQVKIGKLKNGFTYYIRKNNRPENRVEMRLVVNAGSVLEDDDQQGLAHFVEHMCFNGTKNFEKNKLIEYLESLGIQFGPEINAYTSFDETIYMLTLPTDSANIVKTGFQVMEDWAHNVSFDSSEIDKERGVIVEEWRLGQGAYQRMLDKNLPVLLKGSRYAERLPIGKKEIIENAPYSAIKRFYHDWYRPDLMAFIVVGDIDVDTVEAKIRERFSNLKNPRHERKRTVYEIPSYQQTLVTTASDKEAPLTTVSLYYKTDAPVFKTYGDYRNSTLYQLFTGMLNQRLNELKEKPDPPFINAGCYYGSFLARDKNAFISGALVSETGIKTGFEALLTENQRVKQYGFTDTEIERYKKVLLNNYEKAYRERDKTESSVYAAEYTRNFLEKEPIPGIEFEYTFVKDQLPGVQLAEVNQLSGVLLKENDRVIVVQAPDKAGVVIPGDKELLSMVSSIDSATLEPYVDKIAGNDLMPVKPEKGKILFTKKLTKFGAVEYKLSNGARVVLKSTDFKNDEILMRAEGPGGQSLVPDKDYMSAQNAAAIINESGLADYSKTDLQKLLAGKSVNVSASIGMYTEGLSGYSASKDLEVMFQLMYLYFTQPRKDSAAFVSYITKQKALYKNMLADPQQYFFDRYYRIKADNNLRAGGIPSEEEWERIDFNTVYRIYNQRFANASDFTFFMVGSFAPDSIKDLIELYLAGLPSTGENETWKDLGIRPPEMPDEVDVYKGTDPKSLALIYYETEKPWNQHDAFLLSMLGDHLQRKYTEILREQMSGVYTVRASAGMNEIPYSNAYLQLMIPCSPDNTDSLIQAAINEIRKVRDTGISDSDLKTDKELQRRETEKNLKTNVYWISSFADAYRTKKSMDFLVDYQTVIEGITSDDLKRVADTYINPDKNLKVILYPEKSK